MQVTPLETKGLSTWEGARVRVLKSKERQAWSSKLKTGY